MDNIGMDELSENEARNAANTSPCKDEKEARTDDNTGANDTSTETPEVYKSRWRSIRVMYYSMFVSNVSLTIIISSIYPFLKVLDKSATTDFLGLVVASYSFGQLFAAPLFGAWSNIRASAREPVLVSLIIDTSANILYMYLESIPSNAKVFMIVARAAIGFASGNVAVFRSYVSGATTLDERTSAMAVMSVYQTMGFILGPLIQAAFVPIGYPGVVHEAAVHLNMYTSPALFCALLDAINVIFLLVVFKEHRISDDPDTNEKGTIGDSDTDENKRLDYVAVISSIALYFSVMFSFMVMETILTPICMHMFAWTKARAILFVGILMGCTGILAIVAFIGVKVLSKRFNERFILLGGFLFFLLGFILFLPWGSNHPDIQWSEKNTTSNQTSIESTGCPDIYPWCFDTPTLFVWQIILSGVALAIGYPTCYVLCFAIYSKILGPKPQGVWMGLMTAAGSVARGLGPVCVTEIYQEAGPRLTFISIITVVVVTIIGLLIVFRRLVPFGKRNNPATKAWSSHL